MKKAALLVVLAVLSFSFVAAQERGAVEITGSGVNGRVLHRDVIRQNARPGDYIMVFNGIKLNAPMYLTQGDINYSKSHYRLIPPPPPPVPAMVWINGGTFTMGSPSSEAGRYDDEVQHPVTVSGFFMGKYEVTQGEYEAVMRTNPSRWEGSNFPVEEVSWFDAVEYCNKRSQREGLTPAYTISGVGDYRTVTWNRNASGYRLPTEAEWEYACRAGSTGPFSTGNNITTSQANYDDKKYPVNFFGPGIGRMTTEVGSFTPNSWGLYDMYGNVREWCWDWYGDYSTAAQTDPVGDVMRASRLRSGSGCHRVLRGGGWGTPARGLRSANRTPSDPSSGHPEVGFRVVRP